MKKLLGILGMFLLFTLLVTPAFAEQVTYEKVVTNFWSPVTPSHTLDYCPGAEDVRQELRGLIAQGMTEKQIIDYFVGKYGESILQLPPKEGFFLSAWIMPIVGLLAGIGIVYVFIARRKRTVSTAGAKITLPEILDEEIDEEMKKYL